MMRCSSSSSSGNTVGISTTVERKGLTTWIRMRRTTRMRWEMMLVVAKRRVLV